MIRTELLEALEPFPVVESTGTAFRHMFADNPPEKENTRGARWNPPGVAAIYLSTHRETAIAEGDHVIQQQPVRPRVKRTIYTIEIQLRNVLDLGSLDALLAVGLRPEMLLGDDQSACREVGAAVAWLEHDGLLVPSARHDGTNLVVYPTNIRHDPGFRVVDTEIVDHGTTAAGRP